MSAIEAEPPVDPAPLRVAVVDDHALLAQSLVRALREAGVVADSVEPSGEAAVLDALAGFRPDVILLDLDLGEMGSSVRMIPPIRGLGGRVVVVTGEPVRARWGECLEAGAHTVVSKAVSFDELLARVTEILEENRGATIAEHEELRACARDHRRAERARLEPFAALTPRESDVLGALTRGLSAEEISATTFVSVATVRSHIRSILQKLGVNSQLAAVAAANRNGWRNPQD